MCRLSQATSARCSCSLPAGVREYLHVEILEHVIFGTLQNWAILLRIPSSRGSSERQTMMSGWIHALQILDTGLGGLCL